MKKIILFTLLSLSACNSEKITPNQGVADFCYSNLATDGCDTQIVVSNTHYIASKATANVLNKFIEIEQAKLPKGEILNTFPINISFNKTGKKGTLLCGFGYTQSVETIDIQEINRFQARCGND